MPPGFDPTTDPDALESAAEADAKALRPHASQFPSTLVELPPVQDHLQDYYLWRTSIAQRLWLDSLNRPAESYAELREHRDTHWVWVGTAPEGRPLVKLMGRRQSVARVLWTCLRRGANPRKVLKRTCDQVLCVNPAHHVEMSRGSWQQKAV